MPDKLEEWLLNNPLFGILLLSFLGGFIAHMKVVAKQLPENLTPTVYFKFALMCTMGFVLRMASATLGGLFVLFTWKATGWKMEYGFLAAGIFGMFATEAFEWIFIVGRAKIQKALGLSDAEVAAQKALVPKEEEKL